MDWLGDNMWAAWLGAAALLSIAEMLSLDLVLIMLAVGAIAGMVLALVGAPVAVQVLAAAGVSIAMLGVVRPALAKRLHGGPELNLGHGKLVGQRGVVTQEITENDHGRIKLAGEIWSAAPGQLVGVEQVLLAEPRLDPGVEAGAEPGRRRRLPRHRAGQLAGEGLGVLAQPRQRGRRQAPSAGHRDVVGRGRRAPRRAAGRARRPSRRPGRPRPCRGRRRRPSVGGAHPLGPPRAGSAASRPMRVAGHGRDGSTAA